MPQVNAICDESDIGSTVQGCLPPAFDLPLRLDEHRPNRGRRRRPNQEAPHPSCRGRVI